MLKQLPDGTPLRIRPIRPDDKGMLADGLRTLSKESVYRRFLTPKARFSRSELRYLTEVDGCNHVAYVVESATEPVRRMIAVGRFVRLQDDPSAAEVAIVVVDDWQGRGVGTVLAEQLARRARTLRVERFTATMGSDNEPAHRLMARLTDRLEQRHAGGGVDELVLPLAA